MSDGGTGDANGPSSEKQLIGHHAAMTEFDNAESSGRMHHAWLLQGPRGIGKATAAFGIARTLLSRARFGEGDAIARAIEARSHPNFIYIDRQLSDRGVLKTQITVDEVRGLKRFFQSTSGTAGWRVAIIDPIDDLNRNAANALLKVLEEPPERSVFLLVNHSPGRLLPTIRSRCRILRFDRLSPTEVLKVLISLDTEGAGRALEEAATLADGSVHDALLLLEGNGLEVERKLDRIFDSVEPEWSSIAALADAVSQRGGETSFELVIASLEKRLAGESERAADKGHLRSADDLARLWMEESARFREALAFNLERKQILLTHFAKRFALRSSHPSH